MKSVMTTAGTSENIFCGDRGLKGTLEKPPVPIFVHIHLCTLAMFSQV